MRILIGHNFYRTNAGGEDVVFAAEKEVLRSAGHEVVEYTARNSDIRRSSLPLALGALWNRRAYSEVREIVARGQIDVAHFHNTQPLLSPAVYYGARSGGAAVVQTLHNYRLLCPRADLYRGESVCEDCVGAGLPWMGIWRACYRDSRLATTVVGGTTGLHRALGTWTRVVDRYIVTTEFAKQKFEAWGLPGNRITVKPNFLYPDPGAGDGQGGYALYAGRLSAEKGISTLLTAYASPTSPMPLRIVGGGPLEAKVWAAGSPAVEWLGWQPREKVLALMRGAAVVVVPSTCYEGFPMSVVEAFASGTPVLASNIGGLASIVAEGRTGVYFRPGDAGELRAKLVWAAEHPSELRSMRSAARREFEANYAAAHNYRLLVEIYERAILGGEKRVDQAAAAAHAAGHAG